MLTYVDRKFKEFDMFKPPFTAPTGMRWVFVKRFKHWRSGKWVYPKKAKCFCFLVKSKRG